MSIVAARSRPSALGRPFDEEADAAMRDAVEDQIERESTALFATGRLWDDGIIDPRDTRTVLGIAPVGRATPTPSRAPRRFGVFRM